MNEQFSAFLDGEATRDEADSVLHSLLGDEAMKDSWSRQHWIRASVRSHEIEPAVALDEGFVDRVMTAVAQEDHEAESAEPVALPHRRKRARIIRMPGRMSRRWKGVANVAAAASVAGVVLVSGTSFLNDGDMNTDEQVAEAGDNQMAEQTSEAESRRRHTFASAGDTSRLEDVDAVSSGSDQSRALASSGIAGDDEGQARSRQVAQTTNGAARHWSVSDPDVRNELNGYLAYHSGMARGYGMPSAAPTMMHVAGYGQGEAR